MALFIVQFRLTYILTKTSHISIITLQKKVLYFHLYCFMWEMSVCDDKQLYQF